MAITPLLNRLTYADADEVRSLFEELTARKVGEHFRLIPPFHTDCGRNIRIGDRVFINQNCTFYALAEIVIDDDVLIGPNVSLITSEHPVAPSQRRAFLLGKPITIGRGASARHSRVEVMSASKTSSGLRSPRSSAARTVSGCCTPPGIATWWSAA